MRRALLRLRSWRRFRWRDCARARARGNDASSSCVTLDLLMFVLLLPSHPTQTNHVTSVSFYYYRSFMSAASLQGGHVHHVLRSRFLVSQHKTETNSKVQLSRQARPTSCTTNGNEWQNDPLNAAHQKIQYTVEIHPKLQIYMSILCTYNLHTSYTTPYLHACVYMYLLHYELYINAVLCPNHRLLCTEQNQLC